MHFNFQMNQSFKLCLNHIDMSHLGLSMTMPGVGTVRPVDGHRPSSRMGPSKNVAATTNQQKCILIL